MFLDDKKKGKILKVLVLTGKKKDLPNDSADVEIGNYGAAAWCIEGNSELRRSRGQHLVYFCLTSFHLLHFVPSRRQCQCRST